MRYREYIKGEIQVSEVGLGAWQLGIDSGWKGLSEKEALCLVHKALDRGVNFFDTAPVYGMGTSETRLGKALKGTDRDKIVINTKFGRSADGTVDFNSDLIRPTVESSLKRMELDYLDSVMIHSPPFDLLDGKRNDHYEILERLKEEGKIRAYGASLDSYDEIELLLTTTGSKAIQVFFNILHQDPLRATDLVREKDVGVVAKIPLDSGWLTGKYNKDSSFTGVRARWSREDIEVRAGLVNRLKEIVGPEEELSQVAIAFCLANDIVSTVIPGSLSTEQLDSNVRSGEKILTEELVQRLHSFYEEEIRPQKLPW